MGNRMKGTCSKKDDKFSATENKSKLNYNYKKKGHVVRNVMSRGKYTLALTISKFLFALKFSC